MSNLRIDRAAAVSACLTLLVFWSACTYVPPPEVMLLAPADRRFLLGEELIVTFSDPIQPESLEIIVWPGERDTYDIEGQRLPEIEPLAELCTLATSPCGPTGGVTLTLGDDQTYVTLEVEPDGFGAGRTLDRPLQLEVTGALTNLDGRRKKVSRFFDFIIVRPMTLPPPGEDGEPLGVTEGSFFFFAQFTEPVELPQQLFGDVRVNQRTGDFYVLMNDGDPYTHAGIPRNTSNPDEVYLDHGEDGFVFAVRGRIGRAAGEEDMLVFETEPIVWGESIGPITFELRGLTMNGYIVRDPATGSSRWDGTLAVDDVSIAVGQRETLYGPQRDNFFMFELPPAQVPEGMKRVCDPDPCDGVLGGCTLIDDVVWPPAEVCHSDDSPLDG